MTVQTVIGVIAALAILEGLFAILSPNQIKSMLKYFTKKSPAYFRKIGLIELIIATLILLAMLSL